MEMAMREDRKRQYENDPFGWEKCVATIWLLLVAVFLVGSAYNRLGRPAIDAASPAEAAVTGTLGRAPGHFKDSGRFKD